MYGTKVVCYLAALVTSVAESFSPIPSLPLLAASMQPAFDSTCKSSELFGSNDNDPEPKSFQDKLDSFLDQPLFDPDKMLADQTDEVKENPESSSNPLVWFANLVKNDYETAEALYAAGIISFMVVLSQELLRMAKYGDAYQPFSSVSHGSLF
jgi:hypothetical protein